MPSDSGPYDAPDNMEDDNVPVDSDNEDFVVVGLEVGNSDNEEDDPEVEIQDSYSGYFRLTNNDESGVVVWGSDSRENDEDAAVNDNAMITEMQQNAIDDNAANEDPLPLEEPNSSSVSLQQKDFRQVQEESSSGLNDMTSEHANLVKQAMSSFTLPVANIPDWAKEIPEEKWKESLFSSINKREEKK